MTIHQHEKTTARWLSSPVLGLSQPSSKESLLSNVQRQVSVHDRPVAEDNPRSHAQFLSDSYSSLDCCLGYKLTLGLVQCCLLCAQNVCDHSCGWVLGQSPPGQS